MWECGHFIAAKLLQGTALEGINVRAAATRFCVSGGHRTRVLEYAKIIAEYFRQLGAVVADESFSVDSTGLLGAPASPERALVGADEAGLPVEEPGAMHSARGGSRKWISRQRRGEAGAARP